jgi:hypothetical protein
MPRAALYYSEAPRQLLDPMLWIENNVVQFPVPRIFNDQQQVNQEKVNWAAVEEATSQWRQAPPETGNDRFYTYGQSLKFAGMSPEQMKAKLEMEAEKGRSQADRKRQIPSIIKYLQKRYG